MITGDYLLASELGDRDVFLKSIEMHLNAKQLGIRISHSRFVSITDPLFGSLLIQTCLPYIIVS